MFEIRKDFCLRRSCRVPRIDSCTCDNFDLMWWKSCGCVIMENDHRGREHHSMRIEGNYRLEEVKAVKHLSHHDDSSGGGFITVVNSCRVLL